jgi:hypothetical protein
VIPEKLNDIFSVVVMVEVRRARAVVLAQQHIIDVLALEIQHLRHYQRYFEPPTKRVSGNGTEFMQIFFVKGHKYEPLNVELHTIRLITRVRTRTPGAKLTKFGRFAQSFPIHEGTYAMGLIFGANVLHMNYPNAGQYNVIYQSSYGETVTCAVGKAEAFDLIKNLWTVYQFPILVEHTGH